MAKSIKKNYIFNLLFQIFNLITPLITTPYVSRVLGADGLGVYSYIAAIASNFILVAGLGTSIYGEREIAYKRDDKNERSRVFWSIEVLSIISVSITLIAYIVFSLIQTENRLFYFFCAMNLVAVAFDITWFFSGMEEFGKITFRNVLFKSINILLIFILVKTPTDLDKYIFIITSIPMISSFSLWTYLPHYIFHINLKEIKLYSHFKGTLELFIPTIAIQIYSVLDKVMLGYITGNNFENGYYDQAYKMTRMVLTVIAALGTVMIPRIGYYYKNGMLDDMKRMLQKGFNYAWFITVPTALGLIGCADNLVPWFWGPGYESVIPLLKILSFIIIFVGLNNVTGMQYLIPTGKQRLFTLTVCCGAVTNLILNAVLIPTYMSVGAAIASCIAEAVVLGTELWVMRRDMDIKDIFKQSGNYLISGILMLIVLECETLVLSPSILSTLIMILTGMVVYFISLLLLKDRFFKNTVLQTVKSYLMRVSNKFK